MSENVLGYVECIYENHKRTLPILVLVRAQHPTDHSSNTNLIR